jgi:hypothetical protein
MGIQPLGKEVRFLIPILRNTDRQPHEITQWEWLDNRMYTEFPEGWQQLEFLRTENAIQGTVKGHWFDKEKNEGVADDCVEFIVAIPTDRMSALEHLFEELCVHFDQKCIYFSNGGDAALYFPKKSLS